MHASSNGSGHSAKPLLRAYMVSTTISSGGPISDLNILQTDLVSCLYRATLDVMQHSVVSYLDLCV